MTTCADGEAVAIRAAEEIARDLQRAREHRGIAHLALSGGTTPTRTYERLAAEPIGWVTVEAWFADERCVSPEDEQSNYRLTAETLLHPAEIPPASVHRMRGELGPQEGADRYAEELRARIAAVEHGLPVLDLVILGIGSDGHVASLFPDAATLEGDQRALCLPVWDSPKQPPQRITLSLGVLRAARRCMLLATGEGKADALRAMLDEPSRHIPASLLRRERLRVIVDDAASPSPLPR